MPLDDLQSSAVIAMAEAHDLKLWDRCVELGDAWLDARGALPAMACIWYSQALMAKLRLDDALMWSANAVDGLKPHRATEPVPYIAALSNYAQALCRAGDFQTARRVTKRMTEVRMPDVVPTGPGAEALEKQGHMLLAIHADAQPGNTKWAEGWKMTERRLEAPLRGLPENYRQWDGESKEPVSVLHEQGIGDAVLIARWLPEVTKKTGYPVTWYGPQLLHSWMAGIEGVRVGSIEAAAEASGAACRAMSLPYLFKTQRPSEIPEPAAPETFLQDRSIYHPKAGSLKVGVCWAGSSGGWHDFERSFPFEEMAPIWAPLDGVQFVNLTHGVEVPIGAPFAPTYFSDVWDSGSTIAELDLVVTVDTAITHIAGSLGVPTLAIVPTVPDWRYRWPEGGSTPFYPSVTVIRKKHMLDVTCVAKARTLLEQFVSLLNQRAA